MEFKKFRAFINEELIINEATLINLDEGAVKQLMFMIDNGESDRDILKEFPNISKKDLIAWKDSYINPEISDKIPDSVLEAKVTANTNEELISESKIDVALNKMDKWLPEDPEAMERYYEIINQESWKEMEEFFIERGNEDILQSYGLQMKDMKKLAKAAMESYSPGLNEARSITKIAKELADVTSKMKDLAKEFYNFKVQVARTKSDIKDELRELTARKKALIQELDDSVAGKDRNIELAIEENVNEKLTRGLKPLLKLGSTITKKAGEDALLDLSDKFDRIDDEYAGTIASHLDMAIELMQDGYPADATKKLKQFNKACRDVISGKEVGSAFESVNEEYIELMQIDEPLNGLKDAWENWRQGPATNYEDVNPAYKELEKYVAKWLKKNLR